MVLEELEEAVKVSLVVVQHGSEELGPEQQVVRVVQAMQAVQVVRLEQEQDQDQVLGVLGHC